MAAKHSVHVFATARLVLSFATAILVLLVVWVAVKTVGPAEASKPPAVVLPSMPRMTLAPPPTPVSPSASVSASPSVKPSPKKSRSRAPAKARTSEPVPKTTKATPEPDVEAALKVSASWDGGYVATVRVTNEGDGPVEWKVTVSHADLRNLQLRGVWNATGNLSGDTIVFTGGRLDPGATASFGYQTSKDGRGRARPAACNALGGSCRVR